MIRSEVLGVMWRVERRVKYAQDMAVSPTSYLPSHIPFLPFFISTNFQLFPQTYAYSRSFLPTPAERWKGRTGSHYKGTKEKNVKEQME